jgi:hypothetical protein
MEEDAGDLRDFDGWRECLIMCYEMVRRLM